MFRTKIDLFNLFDIVAIEPGCHGTLYVQCTSKGGMSHRRNKILTSPITRRILTARNRVLLIGWHKPGRFWEPIVQEFTLESLS